MAAITSAERYIYLGDVPIYGAIFVSAHRVLGWVDVHREEGIRSGRCGTPEIYLYGRVFSPNEIPKTEYKLLNSSINVF